VRLYLSLHLSHLLTTACIDVDYMCNTDMPALLLVQHMRVWSPFWSGFICVQQTYAQSSENLVDRCLKCVSVPVYVGQMR